MVLMQSYSVSFIIFLIIECYLIGVFSFIGHVYYYFKTTDKLNLYLGLFCLLLPFLTLFNFKIGFVFFINGIIIGLLINLFRQEKNMWRSDDGERNIGY